MEELLRLLLSSPLAPPGFDHLRVHSFLFEELHRIHGLLLKGTLSAAGAPTAMPGSAGGAPPRAEEVDALLHKARLLLLQHPIAAQAAFSALVAEGRRFAATPEGRQWATALASSSLIRRAVEVWEALGMDMLEEDPNTVVPSAWLEVLLRGAHSPNVAAVGGPTRPPGGGRNGEPG